MAKAFYILGNPPWAQGDVANASGEEAALIPPRKGGNADDELEGYRESAIAYLVRYIPRSILRTMQWLGKEESPFLKGPMAPVTAEIFQENLEVVEGNVPKGLSGVFVRTGANPQHQPWGGYHWFDGEGMVHAVHFGEGQAKSYSNHWIRCKRFLLEKAAGCNLFMRFGDMKGLLGLCIMMFTSTFNCLLVPAKKSGLVNGMMGNTALVWHNGKLLALMEGGFPFLLRLCAGAVKSVSTFTFGGGLQHAFTAHPKVDPKSGEMLSFCYSLEAPVQGVDTNCAFFSVSPSGKKGKSHPVDTQAPQMMHDFAVTESYAVFMDQGNIFDPENMIKAGSLPFRSDLSRNSRLGLLKRSAPEQGVQWFDVAPFTCLHTSSAWEEGSKVHLIISRYESLSLTGIQLEGGNPPAEAVRYTIDVAAGDVTCTRLVPGYDIEWPVFPPHLVTRPCTFSYMLGNVTAQHTAAAVDKPPSSGVLSYFRNDCIVKINNTADEDKGLVATIKLPEACICSGEFVVVSRASPSMALSKPEDDAWLVGFVTDVSTSKSYCLVFDAMTMSEVPVAKVAMPQRVPLGFHGMFVHTEQLKMQST